MPGGTAGNIGGMSSTAGAAGYGAGAPIPIPASLRVMPLGDSLTAGQYDDGAYDIDGGYRGPLRAMLLGATFVGSVGGVHEGHPGYGTKRLADGLPGWLASARPDVVLLMIGTNDLGWTEESTAVATEMTYIVGPALAAGARVFVATLIPTGATDRDIQARRVNYNALLTSAVRAHPEYGKRLHLVDAMAMALALGTTDYRASSVVQVHPEALGYRKMAQVWASAMAAAQ